MSKRDSRNIHPWEYPNCPECGGHLFVDRCRQPAYGYICHNCDVRFNE